MISAEFGFLFPSLTWNIDGYFCLLFYNGYHLPYELLPDRFTGLTCKRSMMSAALLSKIKAK